MRFVNRLPDRFGRMGTVGDRLTMTAPWYPLVVDGDAFRFDVPHRVRIDTTAPLDLLVGGERVAPGSYLQKNVPFVPVVAAPTLYRQVVERAGLRLTIYSPSPLYQEPGPEVTGLEGLDDLLRIDVGQHMGDALEDVQATLEKAEVRYRQRDLVVAMVPSRVELVATAPGVILCSDNIYEIFPLDVSLEFHQRAFRRGVFRQLVAPLSADTEAPIDRSWVDDLRAVFLIDVDDARRNGAAMTPQELVGFAAFHPSVDALLYAAQVQYVETFFGSIDEPDPFRDDPGWSRRAIARGRRILESARDALTDEEFESFTRQILEARRSVRAILEEVSPAAAERLPTWLDTPNLLVNYRYGELSSEPAPGGGYINRVEVFRDGADRREPVEVLIEDDEGNEEIVVWDAPGHRGVVEAHMPAPIDDVWVDPRGRLTQSPQIAPGNVRGDDATSKPFRPPLLTGFGLNLALSEGHVFGFLSFAVRRKWDLEEAFLFTLSHLSSTTGGTARYFRGLGPKRTNNARIGSITAGFNFDRVREDFVEAGVGGWRVSLIASAGFDTRAYFVDPREGSSLSLNGRVGGVFRDNSTFGVTGSLNLRGSHTFTLGQLAMLLIVAGGGWTFGDALPGELQQLGGRFLLRAYETRELVGRGKLYAVSEFRYTPIRDLRWNIAHVAWLREIQTAVWAGGGMTIDSVIDDTGLPSGALRFAAEVGLGLRLHYTYAGVQPGVMSIDVGVPFRDPNGIGSDGRRNSERLPFGLYISFDQFF